MRPSIMFVSMLYLTSAPLLAQTSPAGASCVDVTVNDHPALSYACLNQRLASAANAASGPQLQMDAVTSAPGNQQVGQFNFSALSHRMGGNLGKSVYPQRPPPALPPSLLGLPIGVH